MSLFKIFFPNRSGSAAVAKERLQIVLAHERASRDGPEFLPQLQKELLAVVARYVDVRDDMLRVKVGREGNASMLEINVELGIPSARSNPCGARASAAPV